MNVEQFREKYNNFIKIIVLKNPDKQLKISNFAKVDDDQFLINLANNISNVINNKKNGREYLLNNNPKLFTMSHDGVFVNVIGNINLKKIFENCDKGTSKVLWQHMILLYVLQQIPENTNNITLEPTKQEYIEQRNYITTLLDKLDELNNVDVEEEHEETENPIDDMIFDIADTFKNVMSARNTNEKKPPIKELLKTTRMITDKYREKLSNGEITPTDMLGTLTRLLQDKDQGTETINDIFKEKADETKRKELDEFYNKDNIDMTGAFDDILGGLDTNNLDVTSIPTLISEISRKVESGEIDISQFEPDNNVEELK